MPELDTKTGNSSRATQAVDTGSRLQRNLACLRYLHWTHRPRLSGCLISIETLKKGMTCPMSTPTSSGSFFPACSTTINTLCLPSSHLWTLAVTLRILVCGTPGCRAPPGVTRPQTPYSAGLSSSPSPPLRLVFMLHNSPEESSFNPLYIFKDSKNLEGSCCWLELVSGGPGWLGSPCLLSCRRWELDIESNP